MQIAFDADRADPRYRIPVVEGMPHPALPKHQAPSVEHALVD
jgi:hypothetical protein